jgi:hypothetical protein
MKNLISNIVIVALIIFNGYVYYNIFNTQSIPERRTDKQSITLKVPVHNDNPRIQE